MADIAVLRGLVQFVPEVIYSNAAMEVAAFF